ncbi:MAG: thiamine biosynthesis protein ApbE, partial [Clostridiales bacterium]|nr:thiamine biosynthesis protein ApbE [Clostridiales bacterium]
MVKNRFFRNSVLIFTFFYLMVSTSCSAKSIEPTEPTELQEFHMGTIITERVYGKNAKEAAAEVMVKIQELENLMTINTAGGDANKLNEAAGKDKVKLDPETIYVLETAKKYSELSQGAFDVTVGPLVKAWGIQTENQRVPPKEEINNLMKLVGYKDLTINSSELTAKLARQNQIVDLGGIAKGYAGDAAIKIYKDKGIKSAFVNLGGNVVVLGNKPDGTPWKIGVQNPRAENGRYLGILKLKDKAIVSSGDYERYF